MDQVDDILLSSTDSHEVLRRLYSFQKRKQSNFSLTILGKKLGIASKGHISDMIRGRRSISRKHWSTLGQIFDLSETQIHYFLCLLEKDHSKSDEQKTFFQRQLDSLETLFSSSQERRELPERTHPTRFAVELLESFPMFENRPSLRDLIDYFGRFRLAEIESSLSFLIHAGKIRQEEGSYVLLDSVNAGELIDHADYQQASILEAADIFEKKIGDEDGLFQTEVLCMSREHYVAMKKDLQDRIATYKLQQTHDRSNNLVKVNVQVFTLGGGER